MTKTTVNVDCSISFLGRLKLLSIKLKLLLPLTKGNQMTDNILEYK